MLCSIRTTTNKQPGTTSNWLNRLRSSKGFPPEDTNLDLDHFLNSTPSHSPTAPNHNNELKRVPPDSTTSQPPPPPFQLVQNILSDLFYFGNNNTNNKNKNNNNNKKKNSRKQKNPKYFCTSEVEDNSSGCGRKDENALLASTASLNYSGGNEGFEEVEGEEEGAEWGRDVLRGYSRSEVTVIDTSCQGWKFEKVVFRRKDVWKVRDKKGRPGWDGPGGSGKRKRSGGVEVDRKKKVKGLEKLKGDGLDSDVRKLQHKKMEEFCKVAQNDGGQFLKKSFPLSGSPKKSKNADSSAIQNRNLSESTKSGKKIRKILVKESKTLRLETSPIELCN